MSGGRPWRAGPDGLELAVRLTPRGGRAGIEGVMEQDGMACLRVRVSAPPVDGAANKALILFLAKTLGVARSDISFIAGERARIKRLRIAGDEVAARLEALCKG